MRKIMWKPWCVNKLFEANIHKKLYMQIFHFFILIQNNNKKNALKFKTNNWLSLLQLYLLIWGECPISSDDEGVGGTILGACGYLYYRRLVVQAHAGLGQDPLAILVTYCLNLRRKQKLWYSLHTGLHITSWHVYRKKNSFKANLNSILIL